MSADPTTWGVQAGGFIVPNADEILQATQADLRAYVSSDFDTDPDSPDGQVDGIRARQLALLWEQAGIIHDANNPDNAEGELLVEVCKLSGTKAEGPQPTTVACGVVLTNGTLLANGTALASIVDHPDVLFTPAQNFTAPNDGTFTVTFVCTVTGPVACPPSTLTVITTPLTGWTSVTNPAAGVLGNNGDTDTTLRARRDAELAASGSTTTDAIAADILALGANVISATVLTNRTAIVDGNGLPPNTFECVVYHSLSLDLTTLAQAIYLNQPAGIRPVGSTHITFVDSDGVTRDAYYSPVTTLPITLTYTLSTTAGYVGNTQAALDIATAMTKAAVPGGTIVALRVEAAALNEAGVVDVTAFTINGGSTNVTVTPRQIATFDPGSITISP